MVPVRHAQGKADHGADMLFELGSGAGIHGPMPGIMRARGDFIADQPAIGQQEHLQSHQPHQIKPAGHSRHMILRSPRHCRRHARGGEADVQNVVAMRVFGRVKNGERTIRAARGDG